MPVFSTTIPQVASGAVANTFASLVGVKFADTAGHRARLRKVTVAGGGGAPQDEQLAIELRRTNNTADGTATAVNVNTISKHDELSVASNVAAMNKTYTGEPTTVATDILGGGGLNARGLFVADWTADIKNAPQWGKNQTLVIRGAPGQAVALNLTVALEWEEF